MHSFEELSTEFVQHRLTDRVDHLLISQQHSDALAHGQVNQHARCPGRVVNSAVEKHLPCASRDLLPHLPSGREQPPQATDAAGRKRRRAKTKPPSQRKNQILALAGVGGE